MSVDVNTLEKYDESKALDVLDEALRGDIEAQKLLVHLIKNDPNSFYYPRLKDAASSGSELAQALLHQLSDTSDVDLTKGEWPVVNYTPQELAKLTIEKASKVLIPATHEEIKERDFYIEQMNAAYKAISGDIRECLNIASLFVSEDLPQLYDPYLAYCWYAWGKAMTTTENYVDFRGMPGGNYQGVLDMFSEDMAEMVLMFGSREQKYKALSEIKNYVDKYWGALFLCTDNLIYALLGMPPSKACRKLGYTIVDVSANRELAIEYYKRMIDDDIAKAFHEHARCMADEFENLLGIKYYQKQQTIQEKGRILNRRIKNIRIVFIIAGAYLLFFLFGLRKIDSSNTALTFAVIIAVVVLFINCIRLLRTLTLKKQLKKEKDLI